MRDFNRFSKILWRFWPCFFALRHLDTSERDFIGDQPKKFREGEPDRTEGEGESRTETEWEGKRRNAPGKNTYGGTVPVLSERSFWPMKKRRGPPGRKKIWGGGKYQDFPKPGRTRRGGGFSNQRKNPGGRRRRGPARTAEKSEGRGGKIGPERGKARGKTRAPERPARTGGRKKILKRRRPRKAGKIRPRFRFNTSGEKRRGRGRKGHVKKS